MVILEEGNLPHPRFPMCDIMVLWRSLNGMHWGKVQCKRGAERKQQSLAVEEETEFTSRAFSAYGRPLEMVTSF